MTKETKIGLLVGLTFIILFAIILSEKGATNYTQSPSALTLADAGDNLSATDGAEPLRNAGRLPVETKLASPIERHKPAVRAARSMAEEPVGQPIPAEDEPILPIPESVVNRLNMPMIESEVPFEKSTVTHKPSMSLTNAVAAALNPSGPSNSNENAKVQGRLQANAQSSKPNKTQLAQTKRSNPSRAVQSMRIIARHRIRPGESLGKIAARYFGRSTPDRINAIFNANRDKLTSIHSLRAGDVLRIPQLDATQAISFEPARLATAVQVAARGTSHRDRSIRIPIPVIEQANIASVNAPKNSVKVMTPSTSSETHPRRALPLRYTWYTVHERDTLSKIARRELGNEKRFLEIYKLNKDLIPDKNRIKPGMKIRLPIQAKPERVSSTIVSALEGDSAHP